MIRHSRRARAATVGLVLAVAVAASLPLLGSPASADTPSPGLTIQATTGSQTNVAPNTTPLTVVNGQTVTVNVTASSPPAGNAIFGIDARLCRAGLSITLDAQFDPSLFPNCVYAPLAPGTNDFASVATAPPNSSGTLSFIVGSGTDAVNSITCNVATPCALWVKLFVPTTTVPSGLAFVHYDLNYAGPPSAPTGVVATAGNTSVNLSWTAPASTGNAPIDYYTICGTFGPCVNTPTAATSFTVAGLTNFTSYDFNVAAHNTAGFTGPASSPDVSATPVPPAPVIVSAIPGDQSVTVTWTAPAGPAPTGYTVTGVPGGTCSTATTSCTVTGLTNGTPYTFTVQAFYGAGGTPPAGSPSASFGPVSPNGTFVTQVIIANRPQGTLDIAETCANGYTGGTFGPTGSTSGPNFTDPAAPVLTTGPYTNPPAGGAPAYGTYPQTCDVNLGTGVLNAQSTYYVATGNIQTVSVRDLRDTDIGWDVTTQVSAFTGVTPGNTFNAGCLGFAPATEELSNSATYTQLVDSNGTAAGVGAPAASATVFAPDCANGAGSLANAQSVMAAAAGGGLGEAQLSGGLTLTIPISANADTYSATMTFTVV